MDNLSKIEGSAKLYIKVRDGKVHDLKLKINENRRFINEAMMGRSMEAIPQTVARICGTCSIAHIVCSIEAIEKAVGIKPSEQTILLRKLAMNGLMIRDHSMHLHFFCLPDIFGKDSVFDFDEKEHELLHDAFDIKAAGNRLCTLVGGRAIHPPYMQLGGFSRLPEQKQIYETLKSLKSIRNKVIETIDIFRNCRFEFRTKTNFVCLKTPDYSFLEGVISSSDGLRIKEEHYKDYVDRVIVPYSQADAFQFEGSNFMVGALARMNLNREALHKDTKKSLGKIIDIFPSDNIFHNNLAQAMEMLHCLDSSIEALEKLDIKKEKVPEITPKENEGIGVIEAPRGTLYYTISIDRNGIVKYGNLIIPTDQNQINISRDIAALVPNIINLDKNHIKRELEKLIRAYDPCMSCATHFLQVEWI
jgi:coenzyme F420-reducing hydrogenase alpha subunit